jgi:hypothetical protein
MDERTMTSLTRIEIKLEKSEFVVRGSSQFVTEMVEAYMHIFKKCYGHHPFAEKTPVDLGPDKKGTK